MHRIPEKHKGGRVFFKLSNSKTLSDEEYFLCLKLLEPLFKDKDFIKSTPGFYINYILDDDFPTGVLRLNCFSIDTKETRNVINNFVVQNSGKISSIKVEGLDESPSFDLENIPVERKSKILQLRNCWDTSTQIVLDLISKLGEKQTQQLFAAYTTQFIPRRILPITFFEPIFIEYSNFYKKLNTYEANQFWQALLYYQSDNSALGIHIPYNMLRAPEIQPINQFLGIEVF